jgi:hypothetical protein
VSTSDWIQIAGALMVLAGFTLSQGKLLDPRSYTYLVLNFVGATVLSVLAIQSQSWGFALLEGVWSLVALVGLVRRLRGQEPASPH